MDRPKRIWWARPRKLLVMERPGGGGRSHRPERRDTDLAWMTEQGVRLVISTMTTRHNLAAYDAAGFAWHHVPVPTCAEGADALEDLLGLIAGEARLPGVIAVHGNRHTDFVAAVGAAHLYAWKGIEPAIGLAAAARAGLVVTPEAARLLGAGYESSTLAPA